MRWGNCSPGTEKEQGSDVDEDNSTGKVFHTIYIAVKLMAQCLDPYFVGHSFNF